MDMCDPVWGWNISMEGCEMLIPSYCYQDNSVIRLTSIWHLWNDPMTLLGSDELLSPKKIVGPNKITTSKKYIFSYIISSVLKYKPLIPKGNGNDL